MERNPTRSAEIFALRRRVADGSRDIEHVYFPLAHLLAEAGERDEAIAVFRAAMTCGMEDGLLLKAIVCLQNAQQLAPDDPTLAADEARLRAVVDPDLWATMARPPRMSLEPTDARASAQVYDALRRCTVSWSAQDGVADVTLDHTNGIVPIDWLTRAQYAFIVDGCGDPILATARVTDVARTSHRLTLTPASPAAVAAMRWYVRVRPETGQSNIAAIRIAIDGDVPHDVRNIYHDVPVEVPN